MKNKVLFSPIQDKTIYRFMFIGAVLTSFLLIIDENGTGYKSFFNLGNLLFLFLITTVYSFISILLYPIFKLKLRHETSFILTFLTSYILTMTAWILMIYPLS